MVSPTLFIVKVAQKNILNNNNNNMAHKFTIEFITEKGHAELLTELLNTGKFETIGDNMFLYGDVSVIGKREQGNGELKIYEP